MPEISDQMNLVTSTPEEAAQHIDNANVFQIGADVFKQQKENLQPEIDALKRPSEATPQVAQYVSQSPEHAALAAPDVDNLSYMERQIKLIGDYVGKRQTNEQEIIDLNLKKMFKPDQYTEADDLRNFQLNEDASRFSNYGLDGPYEQLPAQIAGGLSSMVSAVGRNSGLIAAGTAAGAALGGLGGLAAGGVGAVPGAVAGAGAGLVNSSLIAMTLEGVDSQMGATYNELSKLRDQNGQPIKNLDDDAKRNISIGVGLVTGGITAVVGKTVAKTVPFFNNILGPKAAATLVVDPAQAALKSTLFNIGKSISAGGGGAAIQKATEVVATEFAKTYDGTEASYLSALNNASGEIARMFMTGAAITGTISVVAGAAGFNKTKENFITAEEQKFANARNVGPDESNMLPAPSDIVPKKPSGGGGAAASTPIQKATDILHFDSAVDNISKISKSTEMAKLSPNELSQMRKSMLSDAGINTVHIDKEDLTKWADNAEKAKAVRDIIDPSGVAAAAINAPIPIESHKFLDLVDKYPEVSELAKLDPEGPNAAQAKEYMQSLVDAHGKRQEILTELGATDITPEEKATLEKALQTEQPSRVYPSHDVFGEEQYLNQPTFTEAIQKTLGDTEVNKFNEAQQRARQSVVDNINDSAKYEMDQVKDTIVEAARDAETEMQTQRVENNPNLAIVDRFTKTFEMVPDQRHNNVNDMTANHAKKGYSPLAIDPGSLTEEQTAQFLDNAQLKSHKVFVKGGISANDSARLLGFNNADTLLKVLSQTPPREEVIGGRVAAREPDIQKAASDSVDLNKTALIEAYNDNTANHIAEMKHMLEKEWPAAKGGIRRIALPLPKAIELSNQAENAVAQTKVGQLNVNQFKVGERKSQRIAIDAILKNQVEKAFVNKEAAALNSELAKQTHLAIGQVNRVLKFAKRFSKAEVIQELKDAGKIYENAANEILDVFNLNPSKKNLADIGAFQKWAKEMYDSGEGNFEIPERLSDIRQSVNEMTVEQTLLIGDRLKNILKKAKMKNKLYDKHDSIKSIQTIDGIANFLHERASKIFDYNPDKLKIVQPESISGTQRFFKFYNELQNSLERAQHLLLKIDNNEVNGPYNEYFYRPIANAANAEKALAIETANHLEQVIEKFGKDEFEKINSEIVKVPEFKNISALGNGSISKGNLLKLLWNSGNDGNIKAIERYGISHETVMSVLERELDHHHMELTQRIWDTFKSFEPKIAALELKTEGTEFKGVQAKPITFKGREYPGGYYPIETITDEGKVQAEKLLGTAELGRIEKFKQKFYAQAMTEQGHLEARTGSDAVLDLSLSRLSHGLSQVIHDLTFREAIRDTGKLLSDKQIRGDIISVLGHQGYRNISDMVIDSANSTERQSYNKTDQAILSMLNQLGSGFQSVAIVAKLTSLAIQPASLAFAVDKMGGISGSKHLALTLKDFAAHPQLWKHFYDFAAELHAPIRDTREDLEGDIVHKIADLLPQAAKGAVGKALDPLVRGRDFINELGFHALGQVDQFNKVLVVTSAYRQALNGEAKGVPGGDHEAAKTYASNVAELTQTHSNMRNLSPVQKNKWLKPMIFFYNDANNVYNSSLSAGRSFREKFKQTQDEASKGNYKAASKAAAAGIAGIMGYMMVLSASKIYQNMVRGQSSPYKNGDQPEKIEPKDYAKNIAEFMLGSSYSEIIGSIPIARDIDFAQGKYWEKSKTVLLPFDKIFSDFATAGVGLRHLLDLSDETSVSKQEAKAMLYSAGYLTKFPSDAVYKYLIKNLPDTPVIKGELDKLSSEITKYVKNNEDNPEIPKEFLDKLNNIQTQIAPPETNNSVSDKTLAVIKQISSKGNILAYNPGSGAAGPYQFTEKVWNGIRDQAPELGLTENGRTASDPAQQEKAMKWVTEKNMDFLKRADLPVNTENLYVAHILGASKAIQVLRAPGDTKLKTLVDEKFMTTNDLKNGMKVKAFKDWVIQKSAEAEMQLNPEETKN